MAKREAIPQEVHEKAGAVARALIGMPHKPIEESKKGGPTQLADSVESDESDVLLKEEKSSKKEDRYERKS